MKNLYWRTDGQTRSLIPSPFKTEMEFEKYVFQNQDLLGDVYLIHRQIRTGSKQGIPDMLGVDQDARVCIIEMKNVEVKIDSDVFPRWITAHLISSNPQSEAPESAMAFRGVE